MSLPSEQPSLETERLLLRPLRQGDAAAVKLLAGDIRVAETADLQRIVGQRMRYHTCRRRHSALGNRAPLVDLASLTPES